MDVSRNALSAYVDGELELTDGLRLGAAVRYEDYDDFGDQTTGKLSAFAQVLPTLALRATASTGFRAPSLQQQFFATVTSQSSAGVLVNVGTFGVDDPVSRALGIWRVDGPAAAISSSAEADFGAGAIGSRMSSTIGGGEVDDGGCGVRPNRSGTVLGTTLSTGRSSSVLSPVSDEGKG